MTSLSNDRPFDRAEDLVETFRMLLASPLAVGIPRIVEEVFPAPSDHSPPRSRLRKPAAAMCRPWTSRCRGEDEGGRGSRRRSETRGPSASLPIGDAGVGWLAEAVFLVDPGDDAWRRERACPSVGCVVFRDQGGPSSHPGGFPTPLYEGSSPPRLVPGELVPCGWRPGTDRLRGPTPSGMAA